MSPTTPSLALGTGPNASKFALTHDELRIERGADRKWPEVHVPLRNVLWAGLDNDAFELSVLVKPRGKSLLTLLHVTGTVTDADRPAAADFARALIAAAYPGIRPHRRLKVFVNPKSGPGKAAALYRKKIEPIFRAAKCDVDVTFTTRGKQAQEACETLPLGRYDAIVVMSGDGLIHEVWNGFAAHPTPARAFRTPVTPIPSGSGNALAINLLGLDNARDISAAALNAIKGRPMAVDLFSLTQGDKRYISFMSQAMGIMADLDLGTEHLRFMGGQRFIFGFLYGVMRHRACPVKVSLKVAHADKRKMVQDMHASRAQAQAAHAARAAEPAEPPVEEAAAAAAGGAGPAEAGLPPPKYGAADTDGWITFNRPFLYVYAGKGPYVGGDLMQFPVSLPNDGFIDVALQERTSRGAMLKAIDGAQAGEHFWGETQHYFKAHAYRVEPYTSKGWLAVDGESFPLEPFQVEVLHGLGTVLSMYGCYQAEFDLPHEKP